MGTVMIKCPRTGRNVSTGIEVEPETFAALPNVDTWLKCSACNGFHYWNKSSAWLSTAPPTTEP